VTQQLWPVGRQLVLSGMALTRSAHESPFASMMQSALGKQIDCCRGPCVELLGVPVRMALRNRREHVGCSCLLLWWPDAPKTWAIHLADRTVDGAHEYACAARQQASRGRLLESMTRNSSFTTCA
jgi:hypothetical protein